MFFEERADASPRGRRRCLTPRARQPTRSTRSATSPPPARLIVIAALAIGIGVVGAVLAMALLALIALCTNLFFFGRLSTAPVIAGRRAPRVALVIVVPVDRRADHRR